MRVLEEVRLGAEEEHASLLTPSIKEILEGRGAVPEELAGVVVGAGPGSFTGVRVGAATAKALAWSLGRPLWAFSSLAGAAVSSEVGGAHTRFVLFDARGRRVYAAGYRVKSGVIDTVMEPRAATVDELLEQAPLPGAVLMGTGALRHRALLEAGGWAVLSPPHGSPSGPGLLRLLTLRPHAEPVGDPGRWEPDYLRESGAERIWKSRRRGPGISDGGRL
jgi:tRNA threonylcarbamoyladenosine biosynthesis protein TsaB